MDAVTDIGTLHRQALVVEDEPIIARVCLRTLAAQGFHADLATSGTIAVTMVDNQDYDIIVSDIRTPGMNGIQFYRYLTEHHPEKVGRVIFTTGDVMSKDVARFLEELRTPWLSKPFTPSELISAVGRVLGQPQQPPGTTQCCVFPGT